MPAPPRRGVAGGSGRSGGRRQRRRCCARRRAGPRRQRRRAGRLRRGPADPRPLLLGRTAMSEQGRSGSGRREHGEVAFSLGPPVSGAAAAPTPAAACAGERTSDGLPACTSSRFQTSGWLLGPTGSRTNRSPSGRSAMAATAQSLIAARKEKKLVLAATPLRWRRARNGSSYHAATGKRAVAPCTARVGSNQHLPSSCRQLNVMLASAADPLGWRDAALQSTPRPASLSSRRHSRPSRRSGGADAMSMS